MITTKSYNKITRRGKLLRVLEQHYLRDDLPCGLEECQSCGHASSDSGTLTQSISRDARERRVLVIDTNVALHQMDLLEASGAAISDVIVLQTVMRETKHRSLPVYTRLLGLVNAVSRRFVPFANEHHRDTFSERRAGESANDFSDRLIRSAALWMRDHYASAGLHVFFVTNDRASAAAARLLGLDAHTLKELGPALLGGVGTASAIHLLEMLASGPEEEQEVTDGLQDDDDERPSQSSTPLEATAASIQRRPVGQYMEHVPEHSARDMVRARTAFQGTLRVSRDCWFEGRVTIHGLEGKAAGAGKSARGSGGEDSLTVLILGREALNRATEGDSVVIELLPRSQWRMGGGSSLLVPAHGKASDEDKLEKEALEKSQPAGWAEIASNSRIMPGRAGNGAGGDVEMTDEPSGTSLAEIPPESQQALASSSSLAGAGGATPTGRVIAVLRRAWRPLCGSLEAEEGPGVDSVAADAGGSTIGPSDGASSTCSVLFVPVDARYPRVRLDTRQKSSLLDKRFVVVVDGWEARSKYPRGHYVRTLGPIGDKSAENEVILLEHDIISRPFSADVMACLPPADWQITAVNSVGRTDLRDVDICSIDPPGCKDIDDALHAVVLSGRVTGGEGSGPAPILSGVYSGSGRSDAGPAPPCRVQVGVHIADVTYFVRHDTPIDMEAAGRANTTYLVEKRLDMLPGLLTETLCSLKGGVERFAFSVTWEYERLPADAPADEVGILARLAPCDRWRKVPGTEPKYFKSIIKSRAAMTYAQAQNLLDDRSVDSPVASSVRLLASIARSLRARRQEAGALSLASSEVRFMLDSETHDPMDVHAYESRETNSTVEEFMLLGNCAVAEKITEHYPRSSLLRRHPAPPESQFAGLLAAANAVGVTLCIGSNKELAASLDKAASVPGASAGTNKLLRILATRCMMQASYFPSGEVVQDKWQHYGLAAPIYTHFTSPIRRYADVVVHRLLAAALGVDALPTAYADTAGMKRQCDNMNRRHLMSQLAGRASASLHTNMFFKGRVVVEPALVMRLSANGAVVLVPRFGLEQAIILGTPQDSAGVGAGVGSVVGGRLLRFDREAQTLADASDPSLSLRVFQDVKVSLMVENVGSRGRKHLVVRIVHPGFSTVPSGVKVEDRTATGVISAGAGSGASPAKHAGIKRAPGDTQHDEGEGGSSRGGQKKGRIVTDSA